jgi:glycosyltransferase involved in cell wall biosynthesis
MEGTPNTVLEAAAAGLPVVATRHAGIPDIVLDGETGLLVDEHDIDGMAQQMCHILAQPEQARAMGAAGRQRMGEHFSMARSIGQLDDCLGRSLAGTRRQVSMVRR